MRKVHHYKPLLFASVAVCLILFSLKTSAQNTDWALDPEFTLTLAKALAADGFNLESAGDVSGALKQYQSVLETITSSIQTAQKRGLIPTYEPYLVLGAAHLDIARMEYSLGMNQEFSNHVAAAETTLQQSLRAAGAQPKTQGQGIPWWTIYMSLGDAYFYKGDLRRARFNYAETVRYNPADQRARNALAYIDFLENPKKNESRLQALGLKLTEWAKSLALSKVTQEIVAKAAQEFFSKRYGSLSGTAAGLAVNGIYDLIRSRPKSQNLMPYSERLRSVYLARIPTNLDYLSSPA